MSIESTVKSFVEMDSKLNGGRFVIWDSHAEEVVVLDPETLDTHATLPLDQNRSTLCLGMESTDGDAYDIDFIVKSEQGQESLDDMVVHSVNGQSRFDWIQQGDMWIQSPQV